MLAQHGMALPTAPGGEKKVQQRTGFPKEMEISNSMLVEEKSYLSCNISFSKLCMCHRARLLLASRCFHTELLRVHIFIKSCSTQAWLHRNHFSSLTELQQPPLLVLVWFHSNPIRRLIIRSSIASKERIKQTHPANLCGSTHR